MNARWRKFEPEDDLIKVLTLPLRKVDVLEVRAATGYEQWAGLVGAIKASAQVWVIEVDDRIIGVFGIAPVGKNMAAPWLLATDELSSIRKVFLKESRKVVAMWLEKYSLLINYIAAENKRSIRWLRWLGFIVLSEQPRFLEDPNVPFYLFYIKRKGGSLCVG